MTVSNLSTDYRYLSFYCIVPEISKNLPFVLQLMGSFVLAVGLWLRFDPKTVSLLNGDKAPDTFFIGEYDSTPELIPTDSVGLQQYAVTLNTRLTEKHF